MIYFNREKRFYSLPKFLIINNIADFYIRKIFPFSFPQKIYTVVSLYIASLFRNLTFFFQESIAKFRPFHDCFAEFSYHKVTLICSDILFFDRSTFN